MLTESLRVEISLLLRDALTPGQAVPSPGARSLARADAPRAEPSTGFEEELRQRAEKMQIDEENAASTSAAGAAGSAAAGAGAQAAGAADAAQPPPSPPPKAPSSFPKGARAVDSDEPAAPPLQPPSASALGSATAGSRAAALLPPCYALLEACIEELAADAALMDRMMEDDGAGLALPLLTDDVAGAWMRDVPEFGGVGYLVFYGSISWLTLSPATD